MTTTDQITQAETRPVFRSHDQAEISPVFRAHDHRSPEPDDRLRFHIERRSRRDDASDGRGREHRTRT